MRPDFRKSLFQFLVVSCALQALPPATSLRGQNSRAQSLPDLNGSFVALADKVSPSVVQILVAGYGTMQEDNGSAGNNTGLVLSRRRAIGSGVIVDPGGYVVTNAHVVAGAERIQVALLPASTGLQALHPSENHHTRTLDATVIGADQDLDLAVIKVNATGLPALGFGDYRNLRQGQMVFAFGSPEGLTNSMTFGVVSSVARQPDPDSAMVYIQTDAPINPGNSGGPLVDIDGKVVGIDTFIFSSSGGSQGLGFAIPSGTVRFAYDQIRRFGHVHRAVIGVNAQTITPAIAAGLKLPQDWGLVISDVIPDGPAAKAGVKIGDIVVGLDGSEVGSLPVFERALQTHEDGDKVRLQVLREGQRVELEVPVVVPHHSYDQLTDLANAETNIVPALGIVGLDVTPRVADLVGSLRIASGVIVLAKAAQPSGFESPLQTGDVIHSVNGKAVTDLDDLRAALKDIGASGPVVLQVEREGHLLYVAQE
jgi:serine protease Do